jgi:hypothetical protein
VFSANPTHVQGPSVVFVMTFGLDFATELAALTLEDAGSQGRLIGSTAGVAIGVLGNRASFVEGAVAGSSSHPAGIVGAPMGVRSVLVQSPTASDVACSCHKSLTAPALAYTRYSLAQGSLLL